MVTVRIKGGLGNQLFQYATGYALSQQLNQPLQFNPSFTKNMTFRGYELPELNLSTNAAVMDNDLPVKVRLLKNMYLNKLLRVIQVNRIRYRGGIYWLESGDISWQVLCANKAENIYLDGYFQNPLYFDKYRDGLLKQMTPGYVCEPSYVEVLKEINRCTSVAVHVRRGDFKKENKGFHYILSEQYYKNAIRYSRMHIQNPTFFWFSDDIEWVKQNIGNEPDFRFVKIKTSHGDIDDMMLMKNCQHIITANSTFSWWAAWLNEHKGAIRICPAKKYGNEQMIPKDWIKL